MNKTHKKICIRKIEIKPIDLFPSSKIFGSLSSGFRSVNQLAIADHIFEHLAVINGA